MRSLIDVIPNPVFPPFWTFFGLIDNTDKKANYVVKVCGIDITPYPVKRDDNISGGKLVIDVKYLFLHVHQETHDICKETSCPVSGDFLLSHSQALPGIAPPGSYALTMKILDESNQELSCITFGFSISLLAEPIPIADG
ncbi:putative phosphatidylglycerol/phosphatidylinositol transfer protein DDB_G0278295 [Capsicum annuum]|uniref:putative phosphatidylglycerol/phosphatidylinositol transfer protein DDB_G0278295 n=1 Tax=Capsicum annuum TaxID=4072 RepID=UPI001FB05BF8|nr:putative phosphatidylglycerol/phosphatidylinositol transfer protein DDB_G0278295 [Capsicum annuum]